LGEWTTDAPERDTGPARRLSMVGHAGRMQTTPLGSLAVTASFVSLITGPGQGPR